MSLPGPLRALSQVTPSSDPGSCLSKLTCDPVKKVRYLPSVCPIWNLGAVPGEQGMEESGVLGTSYLVSYKGFIRAHMGAGSVSAIRVLSIVSSERPHFLPHT